MNNDALLSWAHQCQAGHIVAVDRRDMINAFLDYQDAPEIIKVISELSDHSPVVTLKRAEQEFEKWIKQFQLQYYFDNRTDSYIIRTKKNKYNMNLTIEQRAKIFGLYIGSKSIDIDIPNSKEVEVTGETISYIQIYPESSSLRLILTPLSEITDEDARKIAELYGAISTPFGLITAVSPIEKIRKMILENQRHSYHIVDYLRSKSYHIPYLGVDLYETGIAIEKVNM